MPGPFGDIDFQVGAVVTGAGSFSSAANRTTQFLMPGHHDPIGNGFTLQGAELMIEGIADPFFDGVVRVSFTLNSEGETETELEEAYMRTRNLPWGLQARAGQFFTDFGRINPMHPHEWAFVNQNVIMSRIFGGDSMRGVGAQINWLTPLPWYSLLVASLQNGKGGAMRSFLGAEGDMIGPATQSNRDIRTFAQLVKNFRWLNGFDITPELAANVGVSFAFGNNATGTSASTYIAGADVYLKWTPTRSTRGFPFVAAQFEYVHRWFQASFTDSVTGNLQRQMLHDYGFYAQLLYGFQPVLLGFTPDMVAGLRVDYASSNGDSRSDPLRALRWRFSPNISWFPTERTKLRLQYDYDWAQHLANRNVHKAGNPHYMLDPRNGLLAARVIAERLAEHDPAHGAAYRANLAAFEAAFQRKRAEWQTGFAPLRGKAVVSYHRSLPYLAHAFGFRIVGEVEPLPGISPTVAHLEELAATIQRNQVRLLLMEGFYERRSAEFLAGKTGIKIAVIPPLVELESGMRSYFDLFDGILKTIRAAGAY
ncbi:MAG TPA: metal ABC transporter substrate-binding protein [Alphaproteobacteria bacterium]